MPRSERARLMDFVKLRGVVEVSRRSGRERSLARVHADEASNQYEYCF